MTTTAQAKQQWIKSGSYVRVPFKVYLDKVVEGSIPLTGNDHVVKVQGK